MTRDNVAKSHLTRSGTRRRGDAYQDIVAIDLMVDWLEHTDRYQWIRVEADESGALDDVQALRKDNTFVVKQVKYSTHPDAPKDPYTWKMLIKQEKGKNEKLLSLLQRWASSLEELKEQFSSIEASVVSNRKASQEIQYAIKNHAYTYIDFDKISDPKIQEQVIQQLGGDSKTWAFFTLFQFYLNEPNLDELEQGLQVRFKRLGGTDLGWLNLKKEVDTWVCWRDKPVLDGKISLHDIKRAALLTVGSPPPAIRPQNWIPLFRNPLYQSRPNEFNRLETILFGYETKKKPSRVGLVGVGMVGLGGVGKTQLAVQIAYRFKERFPAGIFWMSAEGNDFSVWQHNLAELASDAKYLPPDDDISDPNNKKRRVQYFCSYLTEHDDALLILDNVEDPNLLFSLLPQLAGKEMACTILYTSRNPVTLPGVERYVVEQLAEKEALMLLLDRTRSSLLTEVLNGSKSQEAQSARDVCQAVGYLPLALMHMHNLLEREEQMELTRLTELLRVSGAVKLVKMQYADAAPLFATFTLSWKKVRGEEVARLFKLASYFPEAVPIPLWLLGIAAGLGESGEINEPLGRARLQLQDLSLMETLKGNQVLLHPLVREFGQMLVTEDMDKGQTLLLGAGEQLIGEFTDLNKLERRAKLEGYWRCLEQVRAALEYIELLGMGQVEQLKWVEQCLDREGYLLGNREWEWWPELFPGLFYQQLYNRAVEEKRLLTGDVLPKRWLRQIGHVGTEEKHLRRIFAGHWGIVTSIAFSPDGSRILTGSREGLVRLWETDSGKMLTTLYISDGTVTSVVFSPDGSRMLTGSFDGAARIWEVDSGRLLMTLNDHQARVTSVAFSLNGSKVLTGSGDGTAKLWEADNGELLMTLEGHTQAVTSVAFSPDGTKAATGSYDSTGQIWDLVNKGLPLVTLRGHLFRLAVTSVTFSPDGAKVLTGANDSTIRMWKTTNGEELMSLKGHQEGVTSVAFSPDGSEILSGSGDGIAQLWDATSGLPLLKLYSHADKVTSVAFSFDGRSILTGSWDRTARLWEPVKGQVLLPLKGHANEVTDVAFSPDGTKAVTGSVDQTLGLWETASGERLMTWNTGEMLCVTFSSDGTRVLTGSPYGGANVWEATSGRLLLTLKGYKSSVTSVAFSLDGSKILTGYFDGKVRLWQADNGRLLKTLKGHTEEVTSIGFSPEGSKIITSAYDKKVQIWEGTSGELLVTLKGHREVITSASFSPDGRKILTSSFDKTAKLWDTTNGKELATLEGYSRLMKGAMFSPHSHLIITWDLDGYVLFWRAGVVEEPLAIYVTTYDVGAIHWKDEAQILLADQGGAQYLPHFYQLKLEGIL